MLYYYPRAPVAANRRAVIACAGMPTSDPASANSDSADPNRAAPSQPEQNAFLAFARLIRPRLGLYYHQNYGWIGGSGASMAPAQTYQSIVHLDTIKHSGSCANGFLWCPLDTELGSSSILIELPDITTPAMVHDHAHALAAVAAT